jgi:isopenicillin-N epimerase
LSNFINCNWDDLIYLTNPTTAMNTVIKGLELNKGDEVLTSNHEYGGLDKTWKY